MSCLPQPAPSTDFTKWTPDEIKAFLDRRGGDFDDCQTFEQLVRVGTVGEQAPDTPASGAIVAVGSGILVLTPDWTWPGCCKSATL